MTAAEKKKRLWKEILRRRIRGVACPRVEVLITGELEGKPGRQTAIVLIDRAINGGSVLFQETEAVAGMLNARRVKVFDPQKADSVYPWNHDIVIGTRKFPTAAALRSAVMRELCGM